MITLNGKEVKYGKFPNKEINMPIKKDDLDVTRLNEIYWVYEDDSDFLKLALLKDFLDSMGTDSNLYCTYLPYSRMDRVNGEYRVSLFTVARLINNMGFHTVTIREPHSPVTLAKLNNSFSDEWCAERIMYVLELGSFSSVFFPDYGACLRYKHIVLPATVKIAVGKKSRDFKSGNIEDLSFRGEVGRRVLIVDDLCSRGGTFVRASKLLRERGAEVVSLLVAYCEDNVYSGELFDHIDDMYVSKDCLVAPSFYDDQIVKID